MKRAISLILALVLCLSMCACGSKESEKYYGTYEQDITYSTSISMLAEKISAKETMTISKKGTGTFCAVCTEDSQYITAGTVLNEGTISWEEVDGYIVITRSGTNYLKKENNTYTANENSPYNNTKTYELKGNKLFDVESSSDFGITKVQ